MSEKLKKKKSITQKAEAGQTHVSTSKHHYLLLGSQLRKTARLLFLLCQDNRVDSNLTKYNKSHHTGKITDAEQIAFTLFLNLSNLHRSGWMSIGFSNAVVQREAL